MQAAIETAGKGFDAWRGSNRRGSSGFLSLIRNTLPFGELCSASRQEYAGYPSKPVASLLKRACRLSPPPRSLRGSKHTRKSKLS